MTLNLRASAENTYQTSLEWSSKQLVLMAVYNKIDPLALQLLSQFLQINTETPRVKIICIEGIYVLQSNHTNGIVPIGK